MLARHATLMNSPGSVANKRLTEWLTPLDATLTKNRGVGAPPFDVSTFKISDVKDESPSYSLFFSYTYKCPLP
jgi:hypothetical protein